MVSDVTKPIISVIQLQPRGIGAQFGPRGCALHLPDGQRISLVQGQDTLAYLVLCGIAEHSGQAKSSVTARANVLTVKGLQKSSEPGDPYAGFVLGRASIKASVTPAPTTTLHPPSTSPQLDVLPHVQPAVVTGIPLSTPQMSTQAPKITIR